MNILSGQLEYVPVLKNAQGIYTACTGRVCLRVFFVVLFGLLRCGFLFCIFLSSPTAFND